MSDIIQQRQAVFRHIKGFDLEAIAEAKVMVIGAGALGNEVLKNLALLNVGHTLIVDFDIVEASNLSRSVLFRENDCNGTTKKVEAASKRLKEINPNIKIMSIDGDIAIDVGLGVFRRMDSIIGCLDNMVARRSINRSVFKVGASWIDGGLSDVSGKVASYKNGHACYECTLSEFDRKIIREKFSCPDKIRRYASQGVMPTTPINASIIGALQAQEALNEINQLTERSILGKSVKYFGQTHEMLSMKMDGKHQDFCQSTDVYEPIIEAKSLSADMALGDFFSWARGYFNNEEITLVLDDEFVINLMSEKTGVITKVSTPRMALSDSVVEGLKADYTDIIHIKDTVYELDHEFEDMSISLRALGIPYLHIVRVFVNGEDKFVELSGDENYLKFV